MIISCTTHNFDSTRPHGYIIRARYLNSTRKCEVLHSSDKLHWNFIWFHLKYIEIGVLCEVLPGL